MLVCVTVATLVAFAAGIVPEGMHAALQAVADDKSSQYNCSISIAFLSGRHAVDVAAAPDRQAQPTDRYAFGSGTKPVTGASILNLVSEGRFGLDDLVAPLVDPWIQRMSTSDSSITFTKLSDILGEERLANLTIRSLMTMKAGVPDFDYGDFRVLAYEKPEIAYSPFQIMNFDAIKTGTWFNDGYNGTWYSTTNYMLLGFVLAQDAGVRSWEEYNQGMFLPGPLKHKIKFALTGSPREWGVVTPAYDRSQMVNGSASNIDTSDVNGVFAGWTGSDVVASAPDIAEMVQAIYGPEHPMVPGEYAELMRNVSDGPEWYGYATFNLNTRTGQPSTSKYGKAYGHLGATYGYQSVMAYLPGFDIALVVASNIETPHQAHPGDVFCFAYGAIAKQYLGKDLNCKFANPGYYTGGCACDAIEESPNMIVV